MVNRSKTLILSNAGGFFQGTGVLLKGIRHSFKNFKIFILCILPVMIAFSILTLTFSWSFDFAFEMLSSWFVNVEWFDFKGGSALLWFIKLLLKAVSIIFIVLGYYVVLQVLYIPFCSLLSEMVLKSKGITSPVGLAGFLSHNLTMFKVGLAKTLLVIVVAFVLFLTSFLPIFSFLPLYFGFLVISYDSFDYGLELYGLSLKERRSFFKAHFALINGHSLILFIVNIIPGLVLLTLPFSVVGASLKLGELYDTQRKLT